MNRKLTEEPAVYLKEYFSAAPPLCVGSDLVISS
jgi:hypothetical protein